jgi:hypothetical protein
VKKTRSVNNLGRDCGNFTLSPSRFSKKTGLIFLIFFAILNQMSLIFHYLKFNLCRLHTNQEKGKERKPTVSEKG